LLEICRVYKLIGVEAGRLLGDEQ